MVTIGGHRPRAQPIAKHRHRRGDRVPGIAFAGPRPEQVGEALTPMGLVGLHREVDQEREVLAGLEPDRLTIGAEEQWRPQTTE
jgi:hypothetical protein